MRRAFGGGDAALVVDLGGGDVAVAERLLDLADVDAGAEEQGGGRRAQGMRRIRNTEPALTVAACPRRLPLSRGARSSAKGATDRPWPTDQGRCHGPDRTLPSPRALSGPGRPCERADSSMPGINSSAGPSATGQPGNDDGYTPILASIGRCGAAMIIFGNRKASRREVCARNGSPNDWPTTGPPRSSKSAAATASCSASSAPPARHPAGGRRFQPDPAGPGPSLPGRRGATSSCSCAAANDLPFADHSFDMVVTSAVILHNPPAIAERIRREVHESDAPVRGS